jgi:quercetin 2,3-dioxygenase
MESPKIRDIVQVIKGLPTSDGAGVKLKRVIGTRELDHLDPFLLLDEFKNDNPDDYAAGFPDHPHRGFETVTYMMAGAFTHRDSRGHEGHLAAGSIQWMTAGRGLIHSEMPEQTGGLAWGFQLWLNLPARLKMTDPKYQDIPKESLPVVEKKDLRVKVLAGEYEGVKSPAQSFIPFTYLDVQLEPGAGFKLEIPGDQNAFLYVFEGKVQTGSNEKPSVVNTDHLGIFGEGGAIQVMNANTQPSRFLLAAARKLNEPIVRGGPFVMNTMGELKQAFLDYQTGKLG